MRVTWTPDRVEVALQLRSEGLRSNEIADRLGGTAGSVRKAISKYLNLPKKPHVSRPPQYCSGEPISIEKSENSYRKSCKVNSEVLRQACLDLFQRTSNRYKIGLDDAMACHLGFHAKPVIPGCERAVRGLFAQRRLAA